MYYLWIIIFINKDTEMKFKLLEEKDMQNEKPTE